MTTEEIAREMELSMMSEEAQIVNELLQNNESLRAFIPFVQEIGSTLGSKTALRYLLTKQEKLLCENVTLKTTNIFY